MANPLILENHWHPVATVAELLDGKIVKKILLGEELVIWCSANHQFMAWSDYCPHRGARLSLGNIQGSTLICPYHGLAYNCAGDCVDIPAHPQQQPPARMRVKNYRCQARYDLVWVCLGATENTENEHKNEENIAPFPEWDDPSYRKFLCGPYLYRSSPLRAMENFLDLSHLPFVHDGCLGSRTHAAVPDYKVETHPDPVPPDPRGVRGDRLLLRDVQVWQPDPDGTGKGGFVTYNYQVWRPLTASFVKESAGGKLAIFFTITPVAEDRCSGWMWIAMNYGHDLPEVELRAFQDSVVQQDITIVESQRPTRLPLDLSAEVHLPCDRASIAYRQWLKQLGVTFGAIYN